MHLDRRVLGLASAHRRSLVASVALGGLGGGVIVVQAWLLAHIVAEVFIGGAGRAQVGVPLAVLLVAAAARAALGWGADAAGAHAAAGVKHELRRRVFGRLLELGPVAAERERTGAVVNDLTDGIEALDAYVASYLPQLALAAAIPLTVAAAVLTEDRLSGLVLLLTAPFIPIFMALIGRLAEARAHRQWVDMARLSAFFLDTIQGLVTLKVLGGARRHAAAIGEVSEAFRASSMEVLRIAFLSALALELVATLSVAVVAVEIGLRLLAGRLTFEAAFFVLLLAPEFYLPMRRLGAHFHAGLAGATAASRLFGLLEDEARRPQPPGERMPHRPSIVLDRVSYAYPADRHGEAGPRPALREVSLRVDPGETVVVVGPSGAGKSTLARILLRFAEPDGGRLMADGVDAVAIDPEDWRRAVAWLPQRPHIVADTVRANLRFARPEASDDEVVAAIRSARAEEFISDLPEGDLTRVGEGGATLSGGEARRLALARAFLVDAQLLILDEPVEDLDPRLSAEIDQVLAELLAERSALVIAHRLPTVLAADRVVVLDDGRVVDQGSHDELLQRCVLYQRLIGAHGGGP